jgi:hypothetical protein
MGPMSKRAATTPTVHKSWSAPAADVQDGPASEHQLRAGLFSLMLLLQVAAAAATTTGFDYFSTSNAVSASVVHFTPTFLHSVDEILEDLANQHFDNFQDHIMTTTMQSSTSLRSFSFPDSSTMPSPKRVADPTGVYGQQDAEAEYITADTKPTESRVSKRSTLPFVMRRTGGEKDKPCPPSTGSSSSTLISGAKAVDYASFAAGVITLVININNNVNNRNNNNNNFNLNAISSSNIASNSNTNIANQVNIMPTGRQLYGLVGYSAVAAMKAIQVLKGNFSHFLLFPSRQLVVAVQWARVIEPTKSTFNLTWRLFLPAAAASSESSDWLTSRRPSSSSQLWAVRRRCTLTLGINHEQKT